MITLYYLELPVLDLADAKRFYGAVFGWTFKQSYLGSTVASVEFEGEKIRGSFTTSRSVAREYCGPRLVFYSDNLYDTIGKVRAAGGKVLERRGWSAGREFRFLDPSGNELAVGQHG